MNKIEAFTHEPRIAYFSMEIALRSDIPTYSGGLGVLAGDTLRSAADLHVPLVAVTLASRAGYFRQDIDGSGKQVEFPDPWEPAESAARLQAGVAVSIEGRDVWIGAWLFELESPFGGRVPVLLLDTDLPLNSVEDRAITHYLYGGDQTYRLKQEIVLGVGGFRMLQALGFTIRKYHMNEGHSALLSLELMHRFTYPAENVRANEAGCDIPRVRDLCVFTTHTPVDAGHDKFPYDLVGRLLDGYTDIHILKPLGGEDFLNMTRLGLNLSEYVNGVAERHAEVSRKLFPGHHVYAITNGAHASTWTGPRFAALFDHRIPGWRHEPQLLMRADHIADGEIWTAHAAQKQTLIEFVKAKAGVVLNPDRPIVGFARRMTEYKRPGLLFADLERLKAIARQHPFQMVLAGKAHPRDEPGKRLIESLHQHIAALRGVIDMAYLPNYNMDIAAHLVSGADLWLNTPLKPLEASGTSGMKAAFNGVPSLSVLDGWWAEGCIEGVTGWAIGEAPEVSNSRDSGSLYSKLEQVVLPLYYNDRPGWIAVMKGAIAKNASYFNSHRMMRRYVTEAYLR
jgi:glycogen phosphorylase